MTTKSPTLRAWTAEVKAAGGDAGTDLAEGEFIALVSVFGNVDSYGDVVVKGAFAETLSEHEASGDPLPVVWSHKWDDPYSHIGYARKATETDRGLEIIGVLDLDNPVAAQVHRLLKTRRVRQFSFAFDVRPGGAGWAERTDEATGATYEVFELRSLTLHEVGPCLVGVNRETELGGVKGLPPSKRAEARTTDPGTAPADTGSKATANARALSALRGITSGLEGKPE